MERIITSMEYKPSPEEVSGLVGSVSFEYRNESPFESPAKGVCELLLSTAAGIYQIVKEYSLQIQ